MNHLLVDPQYHCRPLLPIMQAQPWYVVPLGASDVMHCSHSVVHAVPFIIATVPSFAQGGAVFGSSLEMFLPM